MNQPNRRPKRIPRTVPAEALVLLDEVKSSQRGVRLTDEMKQQRMDWIHRYAQAWGGQCLSQGACETNIQKLLLRCQAGHEWQTDYSKLRRGAWCKTCFGIQSRTPIALAHAIAHERGGWCLSDDATKEALVLWRCAMGHEWRALYGNVKQGHWCRKCALLPHTTPFDEVVQLIKQHDGVCLSSRHEYQTAQTPLLVRCAHGHVFTKTGTSLKSGHWCAQCSSDRQRKYNIVVLHTFAQERGGRCLDQSYSGSNYKFLWECEHGHRWRYTWSNMYKNYSKTGQDMSSKDWCPECRAIKKSAELSFAMSQGKWRAVK